MAEYAQANEVPEGRPGGIWRAKYRAMADAKPGKWVKHSFHSQNVASNAGSRLRKEGYETATRGEILYLRRPKDWTPDPS